MAEGRKRLEILTGTSDFKELRDDGFYFVDKSELISDLLKNRSKVYLFTRPRRFGKSLNLSMLDAFFNLRYKVNNWFDGLKISDFPEFEQYRNAYPVISLSMNELDHLDYNEFISEFKYRIRDLYKGYRYLETSEKVDPADREDYQEIVSGRANPALLKKSLRALCSMLEQYHGIKPIILLDEYDATLNHAYRKESYDDILSILRSFYSLALKDNKSLTFAVVTGVMQIAKEGIFSGLNNLRVNNIFEVKFDERYGFTESEVKELCSYYGHPEKFDEAKEWYDGYRFGNADIYNPWSIMSYIENDFDPKSYWAGTSGNDIMDTLLECSTEETFKDIAALGNGETIPKKLSGSVAMDELKTRSNAIFSVLAVAGYLNAVPAEGNTYLLSIPNKEMYTVFYDHISNYSHGVVDYYSDILDAAEKCNIAGIEKILYTFFSENIPFLMLRTEYDYEMALAGVIMSRKGNYIVIMEHETGNGRHDLILARRLAKYPNIVMEFKKAKSDNEVESERLAHEAIEQIHQRDYCKKLKGTTYLYGICFNGKKPKAILEKTTF